MDSRKTAENTDPGHKNEAEKQLLKPPASNPTLGHHFQIPGDFPDCVLKCFFYAEISDHTLMPALNRLPSHFQVTLAVDETFFCLRK